MDTIPLNQRNLKNISAPVKVPAYSRDALRPAIVHIGLGNFHRAHQAFFLDTLLAKGLTASGIFEMNLIPDTFPLTKIAAEQDYLYTLIAKNGREEAIPQVIGSILGYVNAAADKEKAIARIADAETSLVSLTITEKGYCRDTAAGDVDWKHPMIKHDLEHPGDPLSILGFLAAALSRRAARGGAPLTIMSCDNFPSNGRILKESLRSFCAQTCPDLSPWITDMVSFPCSMVDRITPNTNAALLSETEQKYGIADKWPVCCEDFIQWVLEDDFRIPPKAGFDPRLFAAAGVQLAADVEPYELMKMRLLNGSHSALAYLSYLMGYTDVADAASDPLMRQFLRLHYMEEVTPTIPPVPGIDLTEYKDTLIKRFANRAIGDAVLRLAEDGSQKIPNFVLKPLGDRVRSGAGNKAILLALAGWARFLEGTDEAGKPIPLKDPEGQAVSRAAKIAGEEPEVFLKTIGIRDIDDRAFHKLSGVFKQYLESIHRQGTRKALEEFVSEKRVT
ncbi:mannitol dehydrogenase [Spirochaetia bacterium]|nr:mannitol dehydrogenase [Spirochaetia bacterium]